MNGPAEAWRVELDGNVHEADLETLKQWIAEGWVNQQTRVTRGNMKWIEAGRVPALRGMFQAAPLDPYATNVAQPPQPSYGHTTIEPTGGAGQSGQTSIEYGGYGQPPGKEYDPYSAAAYGQAQAAEPDYGAAPQYGGAPIPPVVAGMQPSHVCATHWDRPAKYTCQSCFASLCSQCVRRYGNTAVCSLCGNLCKPYGEMKARQSLNYLKSRNFGLEDLGIAMAFPFKDILAVLLAGLVAGVFRLFGDGPGIYGLLGKAVAQGIVFAYISTSVRKVARGKIDEGPAPDFSDPFDVIKNAVLMGVAITIITLGPLIAVLAAGLGEFDPSNPSLALLGTIGILVILALLWAVFYYPMALLIAGFTGDFMSVINPLLGVDTMRKMGIVYVKAYLMFLLLFVMQIIVTGAVLKMGDIIGESTNPGAVVMFLGTRIFSQVIELFFGTIIACVLGLAILKRADELEVQVVG